MSTLNGVIERMKTLNKELKTLPKEPIPAAVIQGALDGLDRLIKEIQRLKGEEPSKKDLAAAKAHKISGQIGSSTTRDKGRKAFFTADYYKSKFEALPENRESFAPFIKGSTASAYLGVLLMYHYLSTPGNPDAGLQAFYEDLCSDYSKSPAVRKVEAARALFRKLMALDDVDAVTTELQVAFPADNSLKEFAKTINVKIPAQLRGKGVPKKTLHQRLADAIHKEGGSVRLKVS
ncbi:MAG: hypothetical protein V1792_01935 [Pseudomonadota bacterium]